MAGFLMKPPRQDGFTLIEGLLTVLVISFGFLAIARLQLNIWQNHLESLQKVEAVQLGFSTLNQQRQLASLPQTAQTAGQDKVNAALTNYDRTWKNSPLPVAGKHNQVDINWGLPPGTHTLSLHTITGKNISIDNGKWISRFD
jgi:Tfp pilus assembly protein PilV